MPKRKGVIEPIDAPFDEVVSTENKPSPGVRWHRQLTEN